MLRQDLYRNANDGLNHGRIMQPYREVNPGKELCLFAIAFGLVLAERIFDVAAL